MIKIMKYLKVSLLLILIAILIGCSIENADSSEDNSLLANVLFATELQYYIEGTQKILVFLENKNNFNITYSEYWELDKYDNNHNSWVTINNEGEDIFFQLPGYYLQPNGVAKHTYRISIYDDYIIEGLYRIRTTIGGVDEVTAEFVVTTDSTLVGRSELDYIHLNSSREVEISYCFPDDVIPKEFILLPVRVYKDIITFNTTIVFSGEHYYSIAEGYGPWGIISCSLYTVENEHFLVYSYSREDSPDNKHSFIGVFDLVKKQNIFISDSFTGYDISVNYDFYMDHFYVAFIEHFEDEYGLTNSSLIEFIGTFVYENGSFTLIQIQTPKD